MTLRFRSAIGTFAFVILSACGGGGGNSPAPASPSSMQKPVLQAAPVANAGVDQSVFVSAIVTIDGGASSDSNGDSLSYRWALTTSPAGSRAALSAATNVRPTFVADVAGLYVVTLIVNDGTSDSAQDSASITASLKQAAPNALPTANAGPNQVVPVGTTVTLAGGTSSDADHEPLTYQWSMISSPVGSLAALSDPKVVNPRFVADRAGTYSVVLRVSDGKADSLPSTVLVNAVEPPSATNAPPVANAGADQSVIVRTTVSLDGTQSRDANGDPLTYSWTFSSRPLGSYAYLVGPTSTKPQFVPDATGIYEISLSVSDGKVTSPVVDKITIVASDQSVTSIPDTGTYRCANLSSQNAAYLYSIGHTYLDRDHDGRPCEANDLLNEIAYPYVAPPPSNAGQCYVRGYYRSNGTYVSGYWRRCPS
jgi:hypothetical protein